MMGPSRRELSRQLERERARSRERETELVNQILYLSGRTWAPPPGVEPEDDEREPVPMLSALDVLPEEWTQHMSSWDEPAEAEG